MYHGGWLDNLTCCNCSLFERYSRPLYTRCTEVYGYRYPADAAALTTFPPNYWRAWQGWRIDELPRDAFITVRFKAKGRIMGYGKSFFSIPWASGSSSYLPKRNKSSSSSVNILSINIGTNVRHDRQTAITAQITSICGLMLSTRARCYSLCLMLKKYLWLLTSFCVITRFYLQSYHENYSL